MVPAKKNATAPRATPIARTPLSSSESYPGISFVQSEVKPRLKISVMGEAQRMDQEQIAVSGTPPVPASSSNPSAPYAALCCQPLPARGTARPPAASSQFRVSHRRRYNAPQPTALAVEPIKMPQSDRETLLIRTIGSSSFSGIKTLFGLPLECPILGAKEKTLHKIHSFALKDAAKVVLEVIKNKGVIVGSDERNRTPYSDDAPDKNAAASAQEVRESSDYRRGDIFSLFNFNPFPSPPPNTLQIICSNYKCMFYPGNGGAGTKPKLFFRADYMDWPSPEELRPGRFSPAFDENAPAS
ncbi:hypothetical protein BDK51DRAFT_42317 [Blyttiomyces helicus]|uniref:Uncharacterized protein n=1 Tax=Blyttiomyces helicus TaxID=388810 RepID=A0A4V1ISD7_9FUNG|nr:hypothetical protein BDK51DRAFT_42317 [Blyttiomyces helicus]|eukprot:RKO93197.1 hypothetical protein BDK51DRAFT_42317 [Blyttiomyces helicus]